jgi:hypothetical protein
MEHLRYMHHYILFREISSPGGVIVIYDISNLAHYAK